MRQRPDSLQHVHAAEGPSSKFRVAEYQAHVPEGVTMVQATDDDATTADNVHPFPGAGAEPPLRSRRRGKDHRAAARQAKSRSKTKGDRDGSIAKDVPVYAPPIASAVAQADGDRVTLPAPVTPPEWRTMAPVERPARRHGAAIDVAAYTAAVALAGAAAFFSIKGMVVLFPGSPVPVIGMSIAMEAAKLITAGWLARRWRATALIWRAALVAFVFGLAVINAAGVYAQLVSAHVGSRSQAATVIETQDAALAAKLESQIHIVADLDRRLGQIDSTIEEAAKRGRTNAALSAMEAQRKARGALVDERNREAGTLAALKAERARVAANGRRIETEAAPIRYVAELIGADTDSERAIRWLIALMVLCCDPLAIALTAAASARR
jgi:hypothetical protein